VEVEVSRWTDLGAGAEVEDALSTGVTADQEAAAGVPVVS
jgi:hypothetical protein